MTINRYQRWILAAAGMTIVVMLLFPPFQFANSSISRNMGYGWLFSPPQVNSNIYASVNTSMLITQWFGVLLVAGLAFLYVGGQSKTHPGSAEAANRSDRDLSTPNTQTDITQSVALEEQSTTKVEKVVGPPSNNLFARFWRGEVSLARSYWLAGYGASLLWGGAYGLANPARGSIDAKLFFLVLVIFTAFTTVGIIRSAVKYEGWSGWGTGAAISSVFGLIFAIAGLVGAIIAEPQQLLEVGRIIDGYQYLGGDPAKWDNWRKVD